MNLDNLLDEQSEWSDLGQNIGKLLNTKVNISIAKAKGELKRVELVESKTTELFELKLDIKIQELKNELGKIGGGNTPVLPSVDDIINANGANDDPYSNIE